MIIDTHSHLNFKAYDKDRDEVVRRTREAGVVCIDVGTKYETSKNAVELAEKNENIYAAIGMHPIHINPVRNKSPEATADSQANRISNGVKTDPLEGDFSGEEFDKARYIELAKSKKIVAIGEIGLDYYYLPSKISRSETWEGEPKGTAKTEKFKEKQKEVFVQQLKMAEELNLPVIVHCRMAHNDLIKTLQQYNNIIGVIHCFTGNWEEAQKYLDLGFYLGINGIIFKLNIDEVIKKAPLEKLLVETDCPYLIPPVEGKDNRNEPIFVKHVIQKIADLRCMSFDEVARVTAENARRLFKII